MSNGEDKAVYRTMINAPIDVVWSHLVKTDEVLPFFFGAVCRTPGQLEVGAPMAMQTPNGKYATVVGKVLEFDPPHRYAHSFKFTAYDDPPLRLGHYAFHPTVRRPTPMFVRTHVPICGTGSDMENLLP